MNFLLLILLLLLLISVHATDATAVATNKQLCSLVKPFQLVSIDNTGKLSVTEAAKTLFDKCFNDEFHVVSVAGSFHTGKSFLLNALMNATGKQGFEVGQTTESETRGIWISGAPLTRGSSEHPFVFLDTEGLAAAENTEQHDAKIYSISTLISTHQLYNTIRNIDTRSIEALELLARRARLFQLKSGITELETSTTAETSFLNSKEGALLDFPSLTWVIQNFFQKQLPGETPTKWLHRLLASVATSKQIVSGSITAGPSDSGGKGPVTLLLDHPSTTQPEHDDNEKNHRSTSTLRNIFAPMNAVTMHIPTYDPLDLSDLSKANLNTLLPRYMDDLNVLWRTIEESLNRPNVRKQSGSTLHTFLKLLVTSSNDNNLDSLPSLWYKYIETQKDAALTSVSGLFEQRAAKYDLVVPLAMKTYTADMQRLATTSQSNVVQLLFGLSSPTIESTKLVIQEHLNALKATKIKNNLNKIQAYATETYQKYSKKGVQKMTKSCVVPTASKNIRREAKVIATEMVELFQTDTSRYSQKYTNDYLDELNKALASQLSTLLELNKAEMEKIVQSGKTKGTVHFKRMFADARFPGTECYVQDMFVTLKNKAIEAATDAFDATTKLCATEKEYRAQRTTAINYFTNALDSVYADKNDKCIQKYIGQHQRTAATLFETKSKSLENSFPIFDQTQIANVHQDNKQAMLARFKSSAGRFQYHAQYRQARATLVTTSQQGLKELQETNARQIKKSVDPVLKDIKALLKRQPTLTKCELGPFDIGKGSCVAWFRGFVEKETKHRLRKEWAGDAIKMKNAKQVVELFLTKDLRKFVKKCQKQDGKNESTRKMYFAIGVVVVAVLFGYVYTNKQQQP
jgi:GTPase Era involved in 16S rRNA processing